MRARPRTDGNQSLVIDVLRAVGATVVSLAAVGAGLPDLLIGFRGKNFLVEVKDGERPPSERRLTRDQVIFFGTWRGQRAVARNAREALCIVGAKLCTATPTPANCNCGDPEAEPPKP